jgi:predicted outer membrane lipoprotein
MVTVVISFFAAFRAGEMWTRWVVVGAVLAAAFVLISVMIYRHDERVTAEVITKIERSNTKSRDAADAASQGPNNCSGKWNREVGKCDVQ